MKAKLTGNYDPKYVKGFEVKIDKIEPAEGYGSKIRVHVLNVGKTPIWLDWGWVNKKAMDGRFVMWEKE